jgi:sugar phosphate permease
MKPHNVTRISIFIMFTGAWFRLLCATNNSFWPILAGEVWMSLACPLFFNMMTQFCGDWFPDNERTGVTALCGLSIPLGNLVAFLMSGIILQGIDTTDYAVRRQLVQRLIWVQNIWVTLVCVPYFVLLRDKPGAGPRT